MMKNKILQKMLLVCIMAFSIVLIGCGATETDIIATAYEDLYESNFTYTEVHNIVDDNATSYAYNGEFTADPYIKHLTVVQGEALWSEVYAYEVEDELKGVLKVDGEWQEGLVNRTEFIGYENRESIEVLSQEETTIDGVTYTVYDTEYVMDAGEDYDLEEKIEATVSQQYYINKETGKLERIITDATDFERAHNIASLVYAGDTLEDATAKADADKREETVEVVVTYQNEDFTLEIPTVVSLSEQQIDEILVYSSHYAREVPEITATITDESSITEITQFFDELEYREATEEESLEYYDGGGWDVISFKRNGKVVKQYTISVTHFCEEEPGSPYINADSYLTGTDIDEKIHARTWYILSDKDWPIWQDYTDKIVAGELGTVDDFEKNNPIPSALENMYSSKFTYTVSTTTYNTKNELVTSNSNGDNTTDQYVKGYDEDIKIKSKKEETIDGKVHTVYNTAYIVEVNQLYNLSEKIEATVKQQYYIENESGKIVRIVTDCTELNRMTQIADAMANDDMDYKAAQKKADAYGRYEEIEDMRIEY